MNASETPQQATGPWSPFKHRAFVVLWGAAVVSNIGTWMHDVGAGWLMTELSPSPLVVAMVQAATTLPVFLFALIAGAVADLVDRRRLLIFVNLCMAAVAAVLAVTVYLEWISPVLLILITFLLGTGAAFQAPAWQAIVPSLVARPQLPSAIALNSMGINVSRAIGPALAGFLIVALGLASPFILNALSFVVIVGALLWWKPAKRATSGLPPEKITQAITAGFRYVRHSTPIKSALIRAAGFFAFASAYWAMLPLIARDLLQGGPTLYGVMLAAVGAGAVGGAVALPKIRAKLGADRTVAAGTLGTAAVLLVFSTVQNQAVAVIGSAVAGISWIAVLSSLHVAIQSSLPEWVRARGLSFFLTVFFGAMSLGSLMWGQVASTTSVQTTLLAAAIGALAFIPLTWRAKLGRAEGLDLMPSMHWPEPVIDDSIDVDVTDRAVMISITYHLTDLNVVAFKERMLALREARYRLGAYNWSLVQNADDHLTFTEVWFESSWTQHLRHHERVTGDDRAIQTEIRKLLREGTEPTVTHHLVSPF